MMKRPQTEAASVVQAIGFALLPARDRASVPFEPLPTMRLFLYDSACPPLLLIPIWLLRMSLLNSLSARSSKPR
jgi:hypothetical protein